MIKRIDCKDMGKSDLGWLKSTFHFSFAEYYNKENINFGVLRVVNDDLIKEHTGFDTHPHRDMEIVTYIVDGELTHQDSMGNKRTLQRGEVQYMSAGTGITHSEHNLGASQLRLLQMWILPDKKNHEPNYGDYNFSWDLRTDKWLHIVSSKRGAAPVKINQDVNFYAIELAKDNTTSFKIEENRQAYLIQIEGTSDINNVILNTKDALEIYEEDISINALEMSHILVIEMERAL